MQKNLLRFQNIKSEFWEMNICETGMRDYMITSMILFRNMVKDFLSLCPGIKIKAF